MEKSRANVGMLLVALVLVASACGKSGTSASGSPSASAQPSASTGSTGGTMTIGSDQANNHGSKDVGGATQASLELDDFFFQPTVLTGKAGQKLTVELENKSKAGTLHNFSITEQTIDKDVQAGQKATVTVTFPQSGFVEFFCKYHRSSGMAGELSVS
jgi:plastocyanin